MNKRGTGMVGLALAVGGLGFLATRGSGQDVSQPDASPARPVYQYVGVEQTIARIDAATGRIEVLYQRNAPRSSLLTPQSRPWEWREIRVRDRGDEARPPAARRPNREPAPEETPTEEPAE